jgi:hypothetical protein
MKNYNSEMTSCSSKRPSPSHQWFASHRLKITDISPNSLLRDVTEVTGLLFTTYYYNLSEWISIKSALFLKFSS